MTLSITVKAGRRRIVVGLADGSGWEVGETGRGMLEAESISFWGTLLVFSLLFEELMGGHAPLLGSTLQSLTASMTLPFSSATSLTQSVLPVATSMCVAQPLTCPYSSMSSSMLHFKGYLISQLSQSWSQSSPSTVGSTLGNRAPSMALMKLFSCWAAGVKYALPRWRTEEKFGMLQGYKVFGY